MHKYRVKTTYRYSFNTDVILENGRTLVFPVDFSRTIRDNNYICEYVTDSGAPLAYSCNGNMHFNMQPADGQSVVEFLNMHMTKYTERMSLNAALIGCLRYQGLPASLMLERNLCTWFEHSKGSTR